MSGAAEATTALLSAALRDTGAVKAAADAYTAALRKVRAQDDFTDQMRTMAGFILAAEALAETAGAIAKDARIALAFAMMDTGAPPLRTDNYTVSVSAKPPRAIITDATAIPADYMRQPPPAPDMTLIGKSWRDGFPVPGSVMSNSGEPVLTIRTTRKSA